MAIEVIQRMIDDIDKTPIDAGQGQQVYFSIGRKRYEMHLNLANLEKFKAVMSYYIEVAREVKDPPKTKGTKTAKKTTNPPVVVAEPEDQPELFTAAQNPPKKGLRRPGIKAWAVENGWEVRATGRVSQEIEEAYDEAHNQQEEDQ